MAGVITSPSGEWAVIALSAVTDPSLPERRVKQVIITPMPILPESEIIGVGRDDIVSGEFLWGFDNYTSWRGEQQRLGRQAGEAALECLS